MTPVGSGARSGASPGRRGRFITLEGGEGSGKSTQAGELRRFLAERGHGVILTREPGGTAGAEAIRDLLVSGSANRWTPMSELFLFSAARHDHVERTIRPALEGGAWVICDRFFDSTLAYQGYAHGIDIDTVKRINDVVVGDARPDLTIILDVAVKSGLGRAQARRTLISQMKENTNPDDRTLHAWVQDEARYESMEQSFHERLRKGFLDIAEGEPDRCVVVDAGEGVKEVTARIRKVVSERLPG